MRKVETRPSKLSVTKSPKQAAIGGAILSFQVSEAAELKNITRNHLTRIQSELSTEDYQCAHEGTENQTR